MNEPAAREEIRELMCRMEQRPAHVQHVTLLALQLFDQLVPLHGFGLRERLLLEAAGCLHDIGHVTAHPGSAHHEESARLIRGQPWKYLSPSDVEIIAQVARYHRKEMPELTHSEFKALDETDRRVVQRLAAMLRLADSLDRGHFQPVQRVTVELPPNKIVFRLETTGSVDREIQAAIRKGDLAMAVFQRDIVFTISEEKAAPAASN
jgi:exopolyphosphatase/guanosine-5'-triphosphate,3'-diphosphate pyrophosphatase